MSLLVYFKTHILKNLLSQLFFVDSLDIRARSEFITVVFVSGSSDTKTEDLQNQLQTYFIKQKSFKSIRSNKKQRLV
ncbi:hypothetical protein HOLleu_44064 [Holothuria leucospilota]|uniref:Uncharacterized protein n=1 Tax=Holothuria leucospilota TaxID=206669 RepID=A0A9Q1BAN8_HOLLE|nr:hypothetical protein HOLleu_44064 [Holothuria leucospilota]